MKFSRYGLALVALLAGCTTTKDAYDIRPEASTDAIPTAVEWQNANEAKIGAATRPEVLAGFVASDAAADALLAQLKGAYATDPVVLTQIGAVTQLVMCPRCAKAPAASKVWVSALKRRRAATDDGYIRTFCDQQLRLCDWHK